RAGWPSVGGLHRSGNGRWAEHGPREGHGRILGWCGGWRWRGGRTTAPWVVSGRELEPIARLGEQPGRLAEMAESIDGRRLGPVAAHSSERAFQFLLPVPEGLCPVRMAAAPLLVAATDRQPAETVAGFVIPRIGRNGLPQALDRLVVPSLGLLQPA